MEWLKFAWKNCDRFLALNQPIRLSVMSLKYPGITCTIRTWLVSLLMRGRRARSRWSGRISRIIDWICTQVIMGDRPAAERACKDPNPIIDGRKANVNLAILGAKPRGNLQASKFAQQYVNAYWMNMNYAKY